MQLFPSTPDWSQEVRTMQAERRKNRRFQVKDSGFAVINPDPVKLAPIIDISLGGLAFYLNDHEKWMRPSSKLEIMVADCSFFMEKLPFEIISNTRAFPTKSTSLLDGQRYSLKFGHLQPNQKSQLKYFIRNHAAGGFVLQLQQKATKLLRTLRANKSANDSCKPGIWQSLQRPMY